MANPTQIVLENVRLSYVHVFKAFSNDPSQTPKFSTTILIPKDLSLIHISEPTRP